MKTILTACETIADEVNYSLRKLNLDYQVIWLEGGLHNNPDNLRERLRQVLLQAEGQCDRLIFTLGYCGGGESNCRNKIQAPSSLWVLLYRL